MSEDANGPTDHERAMHHLAMTDAEPDGPPAVSLYLVGLMLAAFFAFCLGVSANALWRWATG